MKTQTSCHNVRLDVLLFGDEESAEYRAAQSHVETCPECQDRLAQTAAEEDDWSQVRSALVDEIANYQAGGENAPSSVSGRSSLDIRHSDRIRLDFLAPPSHPEMLGQLGRYQIESVIGAGGMGIVLKGFDTDLNRPVAIKVLAPHLAHSGAARQRFAREARAAAAVVHEHVVAIHNVESERDFPFLVMQYVPGRSLQERVEHEGPLAVEEMLRIGMQAAAGLAAAHAQGVIHRDVKPANILLENGVERALITDFGLARAADDASLTHSGIVAGTPHYMSPEQARGDAADARSDLFSLGAVLYFMAAGYPPFRAERAVAVLNRICHDRQRPISDVRPQIPDELADVIERLLEKKPERRFASADDVRQALADVLQQLQSPRRWRSKSRRWLRRAARNRQLIASAVTVGALCLVAIAGWMVVHWDPGVRVLRIAQGIRPGQDASAQQARSSGDDALETDNKHLADAAEPRHSEPRVTHSEIDALVNELGTPTAQFAEELHAIDESIDNLAARPYPESRIGRGSGDSWREQVGAAHAAALQLEQSMPPPPSGDASHSSLKGKGR